MAKQNPLLIIVDSLDLPCTRNMLDLVFDPSPTLAFPWIQCAWKVGCKYHGSHQACLYSQKDFLIGINHSSNHGRDQLPGMWPLVNSVLFLKGGFSCSPPYEQFPASSWPAVRLFGKLFRYGYSKMCLLAVPRQTGFLVCNLGSAHHEETLIKQEIS